jgi:hypothetical protein
VSRPDGHRAMTEAHIHLLHADGVEELAQELVGILLPEIEILVVLFSERGQEISAPDSVGRGRCSGATHLGLMCSGLRLFWMSHAVRSTATSWSPIGRASVQG